MSCHNIHRAVVCAWLLAGRVWSEVHSPNELVRFKGRLLLSVVRYPPRGAVPGYRQNCLILCGRLMLEQGTRHKRSSGAVTSCPSPLSNLLPSLVRVWVVPENIPCASSYMTDFRYPVFDFWFWKWTPRIACLLCGCLIPNDPLSTNHIINSNLNCSCGTSTATSPRVTCLPFLVTISSSVNSFSITVHRVKISEGGSSFSDFDLRPKFTAEFSWNWRCLGRLRTTSFSWFCS